MKKLLLTITISIVALFQFCFAGQLTQVGEHFCYLQDDGSYAINKWIEMDINADGINESYYFDASGFMLVNTVTPDGYQVNEFGQWINNAPQVANAQQKRNVQNVTSQESKVQSSVSEKRTSGSRYDKSNEVWICDTGKRYHTHKDCSKMKKPYQVTIGEAESRGYTPCGKKGCYGS